MENAVRQRIIELTSIKENPSLTSIGRSNAEKMQLSRQINGTTAISLLTILLILDKMPNLSAEWLLRGVGEMYLSDNVATNLENDTEKARQQDGNELRHLQEKIALLEQNNADLRELAAAKKETIATLQDELADLKKAMTSALPPTALTA